VNKTDCLSFYYELNSGKRVDSHLMKLWHEEETVDNNWLQVVKRAGKDHYIKTMVEDDIDLGDQRVSIDLIVVYRLRSRELMEREKAEAAEAVEAVEAAASNRGDDIQEGWSEV